MYIKNNIFYLTLILVIFNFNSLYSSEENCPTLLQLSKLESKVLSEIHYMNRLLYDSGFKVGIVYGHLQSKASNGDTEAMFNLGMIHLEGFSSNLFYSHAEMFKWFKKAAENGHAGAQNELGVLYKNGYKIGLLRFIDRNYKEALKWFIKAAEEGNPDAQFNLGDMYQRGMGVSRNYEEALKLFIKAAVEGHRDAQLKLVAMYEKGQGVPQDYKEALKWLEKVGEGEFIISKLRLIIKLKLMNATNLFFPHSQIK